MMEEYIMKKPQVPAFGYWDYCDELPITHYFESAVQAGLLRGHYFGDDDHHLFNMSAAHLRPPHQHQQQQQQHQHHHHHHHRKTKQKVGGDKQCAKGQQRKQIKDVSDARVPATPRRPRAPKAVDEDLYKIPPELLYQKPKRKRLLKNLWSGCMGLNSVA